MTIDKYISVFNLGLQNTFVYRWNYFLRALFGSIPLAGTVFLWAAIFKERGGSLHGYDYGSMIYYYLLTILVSNLVTPTEDEWQIAAESLQNMGYKNVRSMAGGFKAWKASGLPTTK